MPIVIHKLSTGYQYARSVPIVPKGPVFYGAGRGPVVVIISSSLWPTKKDEIRL
jgi:hypothetical protein